MLYVTTRSKQDTYTANHALSEDRSPDGGFYIPMNLPRFDCQQIRQLRDNGFSQTVAELINLFFSTHLSSWDIEFAIGRYPVKTVSIGSRETVAELWHNPLWKFDRLARGIEKAIRQSDDVKAVPSNWLMIASRIAVLFGIFGELMADNVIDPDTPVDVAVPCGDFSAPIAVWYARQMGLPVSTVICCCNDNNGVWELLHKGKLRSDTRPVPSVTPLCDHTAPADLERLISARLGGKYLREFLDSRSNSSTFYLEPEQQKILRDCFHVPVISQRRLESSVKSLYHSCGYPADVYTALCYGGMLDYRSVTGEGRHVILLSEESPSASLPFLANCLGLDLPKLSERTHKQR